MMTVMTIATIGPPHRSYREHAPLTLAQFYKPTEAIYHPGARGIIGGLSSAVILHRIRRVLERVPRLP